MKTSISEKAKVGVLTVGHREYWEWNQFPGMRESTTQMGREIADCIAETGVEVFFDYVDKQEDLDVVHLCLPHYLHTVVAKDAFRSGIHVLSVKPMSIHYEDAQSAVELADQCNVKYTYVADDTPEEHWEYAHKIAEMQNSGRMDEFISSAIRLAESMRIPVCDCYSKWKRKAETEDVTILLSNRINHPTTEMHQLFADGLYDIIMRDAQSEKSDSTMYCGT